MKIEHQTPLREDTFLPARRCHFVQRGSTICFVVFVLLILLENKNTDVFAKFVQFHHASQAVDRQHIASFITGRSP
jgi:hypothetical protein